MSKQRLSKLQRWIFENWDAIPEVIHLSNASESEKQKYHSTFWIYKNFFGIKTGKPTFYTYGKDEFGFYQIPNKYLVVVFRSLKNLCDKELIEIPYRSFRGRGHNLFIRTDKGLLLSKVSDNDKVINNKEADGLMLSKLSESDKVINNNKTTNLNVNQESNIAQLINNNDIQQECF